MRGGRVENRAVSEADVNAESVSVADRFDLSFPRRIEKAAVMPSNAAERNVNVVKVMYSPAIPWTDVRHI